MVTNIRFYSLFIMTKACIDNFYDSRGSLHKIGGIPSDFSIKQVIVSKTLKAWTVRGLHYSSPPMEESKIISCIKGKLAWLCIQKNNSEILHYQLYELSEKDKIAITLPKGSIHGCISYQDNTEIQILSDSIYSSESSINFKWGNILDKVCMELLIDKNNLNDFGMSNNPNNLSLDYKELIRTNN